MKFRKKPVVIEAISVAEVCDGWSDPNRYDTLPAWVRAALDEDIVVVQPATQGISVTTLGGTMQGQLDDILIQGITGELYPCKPDIFAATYEPVGD